MSVRSAALAVLAVLAAAAPAEPQSRARKDPRQEIRARVFRERLLHHFTIGVDAPREWFQETRDRDGARWDFRPQYLSGGAATGETPWWLNFGNSPARIVAEAKEDGVVPWFTFYALAYSAPARYRPGPAEATPVNAKVPETMREYFGLFKRVMEGCGKDPSWPVMVQIEPDEWGHLLASGGMDPRKADVKVGSCGMEELKGLPDNLQGWAAAFVRLRDLYAPQNVMLGCNPSAWDYRGSMSGARMGALFRVLGEGYEFAVLETGDRDKGETGQMPPYGEAIRICDTLANHLAWVSDFHRASGLPVYVWQAAMGNTHFATCDNSQGHYTDNLAQLLLEGYPKNPTISRYAAAGCAGWLFLGGQGDRSTQVWDARKDGVTNPEPVPGNAGNKSVHADDDGGYLRMRGAAYTRKPFPLGKRFRAR